MAPHTSGKSRAGSRLASRAGSAARDIVKRRDKQYKTEQQTVFAPKKKLSLHTSYAKAPPGYKFVPVGTPELAEKCKELSRQRGFPVHVVNAKPTGKNAQDPLKVSHHVHRIGYHFKAEVIGDACETLNYIFYNRRYVKEADLWEQRRKKEWAKTLETYGLQNFDFAHEQRESPEQVRAAIKELFPKIPEKDLNEIVTHAWAEGTNRVGNTTSMELPRRVQLATIARIRHLYTDYDRLLRAFEWKEARTMVEPYCLAKLIEWRGEEDVDDEGFEEIVRETIVIDDNEDGDANATSEADDEDDSGGASDTSLEITHHVANDADFGAESMDERAHAYVDRLRPRRRGIELRRNIAKQKIGDMRQRLRDGEALSLARPAAIAEDNVLRPMIPIGASNVQIPPDRYGRYPEQVVGRDGQVYRLLQVQPGSTPYSPVDVAPHSAARAPHIYDKPVASIESEEFAHRPRHSNPHTADSGMPTKRRRVEPSPPPPNHFAQSQGSSGGGPLRPNVPAGPDMMDLTTPELRERMFVPGLSALGRYPTHESRSHYPLPYGTPGQATGPPPQLSSCRLPSSEPSYHDSRPTAHDYSRQPVAHVSHAPHEAPRQYVPSQPYAQPPPEYTHGHPRIIYRTLPEHERMVHGAPAPVQVVPITVPPGAGPYAVGHPAANGGRVGEVPRHHVPANGAIAPTQYYPR